MTALSSDFGNLKLQAEFQGDYVAHRVGPLELSVWRQAKIIGKGAYGTVHLQEKVYFKDGHEHQTGQVRAVKRIPRNPLLKEGLSQELSVLLRLKDHDKHFVNLSGWYTNNDHIFYAMEYIKDGDLHSYMTQDRVRARLNAKEITRQMLEGLVVLHQENICHRDLKPQNVLVTSIEPIWVKIADFGVAKQLEGTAPRTGHGTDGYRAPEILRILPQRLKPRRQIGYALDIWSLGAMVHELLTSHPPFFHSEEPGDESEQMTDATVASSLFKPELDYGIFIEFCCGKIEFPTEGLRDSGVSPAGIELVKSLLIPDPKCRPEPLIALRSRLLCDWIGGVIGEFLGMGVDLDLRSFRTYKISEKDGFQVSLPASAREKGHVLLKEAMVRGYVSATSVLLGIPGGEPIGPSTSTTYSEAFQLAIELQNADLVKLFLRNFTFIAIDAEGAHDGRKFLQIAPLEREDNDLYKKNYQKVLELAIIWGHSNTVRILLRVGVGTDSITGTRTKSLGTFRNRTGLQLASESGQIEIARLFLEAGCDVNAPAANREGRTALQAAAGSGHIDIVKLLLQAGADVNAPVAVYGGGRRALQAAAGSGHIDIVKLLLQAGADVNAPANNWGRTALQAAAGSGHIDIVKLLLQAGADVNAPAANIEGITALQAAAGSGHIDIVELLLKAGADVNAEGYYGTALEAAARNGDMVKLLRSYSDLNSR